MTLFSFFKRKPEPEIVTVPHDGIKALADGILFEDGFFLKWGADIEADKLYVKKGFRADRVIYEWGERVIMDGLKLPFKTICWNHKQHGNTRSLESIDFSAEGNDAEAYFQSIRVHVESIYGEPKVSDDLQPGDIGMEWKIKAVKISLSLFNKEHPKVHFEIGWWV